MRLTSKSQYGLLVLAELIRAQRKATTGTRQYLQVGELAVKCGASPKYLEQVLLPLTYAGILESKRGANGGYRLRMDPETVSLASALNHLEGRLMPMPTWLDGAQNGNEGRRSTTRLAELIVQVRDSVSTILEGTSIEVLAEDVAEPIDYTRSKEAVEALMFYI